MKRVMLVIILMLLLSGCSEEEPPAAAPTSPPPTAALPAATPTAVPPTEAPTAAKAEAEPSSTGDGECQPLTEAEVSADEQSALEQAAQTMVSDMGLSPDKASYQIGISNLCEETFDDIVKKVAEAYGWPAAEAQLQEDGASKAAVFGDPKAGNFTVLAWQLDQNTNHNQYIVISMGSGQASGGGGDKTEPAAPSSGGDKQAGGTAAADLGFRPDANGLPFPNYGEGFTNLTPAEMRRAYGDQVCAYLEGDKCVLTPPAQQSMDTINASMNGGHCYGFSVVSLLFFNGTLNPADFGGSSSTGLKLEGNEMLQRVIAYYFNFQTYDTVWQGVIAGTPNEVLDKLAQSLQNKSELYTLAIFRADGQGGHAITPFAIEDRGNDQAAILVYDNNHPGQVREVLVDRKANKWSYQASTNPNEKEWLYEGDASMAQHFMLMPTKPGLQQQSCAFCQGGSKFGNVLGSSVASKGETLYTQVRLVGRADLLVKDEQGHRLGYVDGKLVNEIPQAKANPQLSDNVGSKSYFKDDPEPVYLVPSDLKLTLIVDGSRLKAASRANISLVGPSFNVAVEGIKLKPGQKDTIIFDPAQAMLKYETESSRSPNFVLGFARKGEPDFRFDVKDIDLPGGGAIEAKLNGKNLDLKVKSKQGDKSAAAVGLTRIDEKKGQEVFYNDQVALKPGSDLILKYADWQGNNDKLDMSYDNDGDGEGDEDFTLADEGDIVETNPDDIIDEGDMVPDEQGSFDEFTENDEQDITQEEQSLETEETQNDNDNTGGDNSGGGDSGGGD